MVAITLDQFVRNLLMPIVPLKSAWVAAWLAGAIMACAAESWIVLNRHRTTPVVDSDPVAADRLIIAQSQAGSGSAILVLGNPGSAHDGDIEVTLRWEATGDGPIPRYHCHMSTGGGFCQVAGEGPVQTVQTRRVDLASTFGTVPSRVQFEVSPLPDGSAETPVPEVRRVFFLQSPTGLRENQPSQIPIASVLRAENERVRVYVDERLEWDRPLKSLVQSIRQATAGPLGSNVESLVGPVHDIDGDGHLAIVVTPNVALLAQGSKSVDGVTQRADFQPGIERPVGNTADVFFVSSKLNPGDQLLAVLAHEWCHAAVFSRSGSDHDSRFAADEDWLNEAIAHLVEVRASGSTSNLKNRIQSYYAHPGDSPLAVHDYFVPKYWRHDGCRGAAFLFLEWCAERSDAGMLQRLIDLNDWSVSGLEACAGRPFKELFQCWTVHTGQQLAAQQLPACREWRVGSDGCTLKIRVKGSCAEFVRVTWDGASPWRLTAGVNGETGLQSTWIPAGATD